MKCFRDHGCKMRVQTVWDECRTINAHYMDCKLLCSAAGIKWIEWNVFSTLLLYKWHFCTVLQLAAFGAELSSEACRELGFSSNLLCSSCDLLGQFSLTQLEPFCRQCCQEEAQLESRKVCSTSLLHHLTKRTQYRHRRIVQYVFWTVITECCFMSSSTPEPSSRSVDENWGGSLKSKVSCRASMKYDWTELEEFDSSWFISYINIAWNRWSAPKELKIVLNKYCRLSDFLIICSWLCLIFISGHNCE